MMPIMDFADHDEDRAQIKMVFNDTEELGTFMTNQLVPKGAQIFRAYEPKMDTKRSYMGYGFVPFQPARDFRNVIFQVPQKAIPNSPFTEEAVTRLKGYIDNDP